MVEDMFLTSKKTPELYEVLGCDKSSSASQITAEYRARVRQLHPDKTDDSKPLEDQFLKLQNAYDTLSDAGQRKLYDSWLQTPLPISFDDYCKNSNLIKQSMHWVNPVQTPMINQTHNEGREFAPKMEWLPEDRQDSDAIRRFRNYEV